MQWLNKEKYRLSFSNHKVAYWLTTSIIFLSLIGCQTAPLEVNFEQSDVDFSRYQKVKIETLNNKNNRVINFVSKAIGKELEAKGYQLSNDPDLVIVYQVQMDRGQRVEQEQIPIMGQIFTRPKLEAVNRANLLINAFDPKLDEVVWKAATVREVTNIDPKKINQDKVNERVREIFESFPVR